MNRAVPDTATTALAPRAGVHVLVMSQHDAVRRELVIYLGRSTMLAVTGEVFSCERIVATRPDVLVIDLSQISLTDLRRAIDATRCVDAHLIALASMYDPVAERIVTGAGGAYRMKLATADGLADVVRDAGRRPAMLGAAAERAPRRRPVMERGGHHQVPCPAPGRPFSTA